MGGGQKVQQTNPAQAAAANAAATQSAQQATALSQQYGTQQQQQYNNLFGTDGKSGAVGSMLDPSKLNVTSPTGVYALQNTNADRAAATQYGQNAGNITAAAQQAGFGPGTPSGFVQDQQNKNARSLADTRGSNFSTATTNQYQDALNNFWKAAGTSQAQGTAAQGGSLQGNSTANQTYANLYGTAGHGNVVQSANYLSPILGAAGTIGSAALGPGGIATQAASSSCCAEGTLIRTGLKEFTPIEKLFEGARVFGLPENDDDPLVIWRPLAFAMKPCVRIETDEGQELVCSTDHTLLLPGGGYVTAKESLSCSVRTRGRAVKVVAVEDAGERRVIRLHLDAPHVFESNGLLSEE
ncbi:MAG TPA: hypothetical protein VNY24_00490 [Candidatus Acidoferrales bacterium]|jgi:hypothetical protein|nr:hypothetical protein [Candidatus Acidoferrales bacterium]